MAISNKDVEVLSEALFCYYFAIYKKKKENTYDVSEWDNIKKLADLSKFTNKLTKSTDSRLDCSLISGVISFTSSFFSFDNISFNSIIDFATTCFIKFIFI